MPLLFISKHMINIDFIMAYRRMTPCLSSILCLFLLFSTPKWLISTIARATPMMVSGLMVLDMTMGVCAGVTEESSTQVTGIMENRWAKHNKFMPILFIYTYTHTQHGEGEHVWIVEHTDRSQYPLCNRYTGQWVRGKRHGQGTFHYARYSITEFSSCFNIMSKHLPLPVPS